MTDAGVGDVVVTYRNNEPARIEVTTDRWRNDYNYRQTYVFNMDGSTAVLASIDPDSDTFPVQRNADTARLARNAVCDLPFVQGVVMFPEVEP